MSSTFDSISYRSDLDQLSFTGEQKARMTARLIEAANAVPIGIPTTHETAPSTSAEDTGEAAPAEILELPVDRADQPPASRRVAGRPTPLLAAPKYAASPRHSASPPCSRLAAAPRTPRGRSPVRRTPSPRSSARAPRRPSSSTASADQSARAARATASPSRPTQSSACATPTRWSTPSRRTTGRRSMRSR